MIPPHYHLLHVMLVLAALSIGAPAPAEEFTAEVYRDDYVRIHFGIPGLAGRTVHFGDVLALVAVVSYNPAEVSLDELDNEFFTSAWPERSGPLLVDRQISHGSGPDGSSEELRAVFRFQILDCPHDKWTCPGTRRYPLPAFSLTYHVIDDAVAAGTAETVRIRPWPSSLTVTSTISLDDEDQPYAFQDYFPTGGYPSPQSGADGTTMSLGILGIGTVLVLGGLLMWPISFKGRDRVAAKSPVRWQVVLLELQDDGTEEGRYVDRLRRCLVWYCTDELKIDPFSWLNPPENRRDELEQEPVASLHSLFIDLLHDPFGHGLELRTRLSNLIETQR